MAMLELDGDIFEQEVLEAEGFVFVDFWSEGCEPCKALFPDVEKLAEKYNDKIKFCEFDIAKGRRVAMRQQVLGLPTMIMYKDGEKAEEIGADNANIEHIESVIKKYYEEA